MRAACCEMIFWKLSNFTGAASPVALRASRNRSKSDRTAAASPPGSFTRTSPHPLQDRLVLTQNRFQQGFVRSWEKPGANGPNRLVVSVFEFADPTGARAVADYERGLVMKEDAGVPFPVAGGTGLRFVHRQGNQTIHGYSITFGRDDGLLFYLGALYSTPQPPDEVLLVARQQLDRVQQPAALGG